MFRAAAALIGLLTAGWLSWMWLAGRTPGTLARLPPGHPGREVPPAIAQRAQSATQRPDETAAIHQALAWLESTQEADGCWNTARWGAQPEYTVGVTALALLALCADRPAALSGPRAENLRRGLDYLVRQQDARGQFGPDGACALYNQSMATLALLEAGARQPEAAWHAAAGRGLAFIRAEQRATGGWGYAHGPRDAVNASVTVWQLQALIRAGTLDFADVRPTVARGLAWLEQTVNPADGLGYRQPNDAPFGHEALADAGILCRSKSKAHASVDHARLAQMLQADHAAAGQRVAVLTRQIRAGPAAGSWEPGDRWSRAGGRIYATAMAVLTLQAW
ncbi:MAG: hypothetical protein NTV49_11405 [Kiritimatiellaeota bacterium]|nr:hypothetical protein [Kiritimatiellota bacterium]